MEKKSKVYNVNCRLREKGQWTEADRAFESILNVECVQTLTWRNTIFLIFVFPPAVKSI